MYGVGETAFQAGVGVHEGLHLLGIARADHHELSGLVLHAGHQELDGIPALGTGAAAGFVHRLYAVGFVQEEHAAHGFVDGVVHVLGRLVHVLAQYLVGHPFGDTVRGGDSERLENASEDTRHSGFTRSGTACKDEIVFGQSFGRLAQLDELFLHGHFLHYAADGVLHGIHAHEVVELLHYVFHGNLLRGIFAHYVGVA